MKRLKELRKANGMTQQQLANLLPVSQQSINKYEHDEAEPDSVILIQMAEIFNTTVDYLLGASDIPLRYDIYPANSITKPELRILEFYRGLSPRAQDLVQELIQEMSSKKE